MVVTMVVVPVYQTVESNARRKYASIKTKELKANWMEVATSLWMEECIVEQLLSRFSSLWVCSCFVYKQFQEIKTRDFPWNNDDRETEVAKQRLVHEGVIPLEPIDRIFANAIPEK